MPYVEDYMSLQAAVTLVFLSGYDMRVYNVIRTIFAHIDNVDVVHDLMRQHYLNQHALQTDMRNYVFYRDTQQTMESR